jgi:hypothetical protein
MCLVVSITYVAIAVVFLRGFEHLARQRASLKLA